MSMKYKIIWPVLLLSLTIIGMFLITWNTTSKQKDDGLVINLAGRQRMLSQKMIKEFLIFTDVLSKSGKINQKIATQTRSTMEVFSMTLNALINGGDAPLSLNFSKTKFRTCPKASEPSFSQLKKVNNIWVSLKKKLSKGLEGKDKSGEIQAWVLKNNIPLLVEMNKAVGMMQKQSEGKVTKLLISQIIAVIVGIIMLIFCIFIIAAITKHLNKISDTLNLSAVNVNEGATVIADTSTHLADGAISQAASIEETSASLEEISSMTRHNADNSHQADNLMKDTRKVVKQSNFAMTELVNSMTSITKASEETSKIIITIDEIAFQTNLLALNAAVEAARAGEAGAGFAVVANEVSNLAMRAANAAKNTSELIENTVKTVNEGSHILETTSQTFLEVTNNVEKVGGLVEGIAKASTEQAIGTEQVNEAIASMDQIIQQNAAGAEESASAANELNNQAENLKSMVSNLVILVTGQENIEGSLISQHKPK